MKITADTNVLLRAVVQDEKRQTQVAQTLLHRLHLSLDRFVALALYFFFAEDLDAFPHLAHISLSKKVHSA